MWKDILKFDLQSLAEEIERQVIEEAQQRNITITDRPMRVSENKVTFQFQFGPKVMLLINIIKPSSTIPGVQHIRDKGRDYDINIEYKTLYFILEGSHPTVSEEHTFINLNDAFDNIQKLIDRGDPDVVV